MARGNGRGRGNRGGGGRGRGRGGFRGGKANGQGISGSSFIENELDFNIQMYTDAPSSGGNYTPRGRGRGGRGGAFSGPNSGTATPNRGRGRGGYDSPRGRGRGQDFSTPRRGDWGIGASPRGRGRGGSAGFAKPTSLSGLLYQERPLLRPIVFVPSVLTKRLFEQDEELIKPGVEDVDDTEQSHVPTADRVSRVFSGGDIPRIESDSEEEEEGEEEEIEEVNFDEVGKLFDSSATTTKTTIRKSKLSSTHIIPEERFMGFYIDPTPTTPIIKESSSTDVDDLAKMMDETLSAADEPAEDVQMSTEIPDLLQSEETSVTEELFVVDVQPTPVPTEMAPSSNHVPSALRDDDDDVIVYVAPHPRNSSSNADQIQAEEIPSLNEPDTSRFTEYVSAAALPAALASSSTLAPAIPPPASLSSFSFSFPETPGKPASRLQVPPLSTPRQAKVWNHKRVVKSKKKRSLKASFGAFGAMREEVEMHRYDARYNERRRGDSDLEWGDTDDENLHQADEIEEGLEQLLAATGMAKGKEKETVTNDKGKGKERADDFADDSADGNGMNVDGELDLEAMKSFVGGLLGNRAGEYVSMDDVHDAEIMRLEDEEADDNSGGSEGETSEDESEEDVMAAEEAMLISESFEFEDKKPEDSDDDSDDDDDDDDDDEDNDQTPRTSFQARLERLREKSRSHKHADTSMEDMEDDSDGDQVDFLQRNMTWAEKDDEYLQGIQDILDENHDILAGKDKKAKKALFRAIRNGDFIDTEFSPAKRPKDKHKDLPPDLQDQWERDRKKKAEYKKAREQARLEAAADPMSKKKGGKKGRKAMLAAAKLDPTITVLPNRIIDMTTLVQQIRRFIADVGGPSTMSLPPTNKETRKNIHEMAVAFNLKSESKGKGDARYTTLSKKTKSGINVNEAKVAKIVRRSGGMGARGDSFIYETKGRGPPTSMPRHREGDEVGKAAPKLNQSNVGFRMLALMGWSEGTRIGFTGGLDVPLTAIIKNTKLGLGANK